MEESFYAQPFHFSNVKSKSAPLDPENPCSLAIIEGALCRLNHKGRATARYLPVGTAVVEFVVIDGGSIVVRELAYGFLPGIPNLYCLDAKLRLLWMAELPSETDFFEGLGTVDNGLVACVTQSGLACKLAVVDGRLQPVAVHAVAG